MARFQEVTNIRQSNLSTGAAQGMQSLANRLDNFASQQAQVASQKIAQDAAQAQVTGQAQFDPNQPLEAQQQDVPVLFGQEQQAFNKGLRAAYVAGIDRDNREEVSRIAQENPDNLLVFNDAIEAYRKSVLDGVDQSARSVVAESLNNQITSARIQVQGNTIKREKQEIADTLQSNATSAMESSERLARNGDTRGAALELQNAFATVDEMAITDDQKATIKRDMERGVTEESLLGNLESAFDEAFTIEDGGQSAFDAAFEEIESLSKEVPKGWAVKEWNNFIGQAQAAIGEKLTVATKARAEEKISISRNISNLKIAAKTGAGDAASIVKKTEEFFDSGQISEAERTSILTSLVSGQKNQRDVAFDDSQVAAKIGGDDGIILDKSQIDGYYKRHIAPQLEGMEPLQVQAQTAQIVDRLKQVPTQLKNSIVNGLRSDNPELIIASADSIDRIDSIRGVVDRDFSPNDRAFGRLVSELSTNLEPAEAVALAREQTDPNNKARVEARQSQLKELVKDDPDVYMDAIDSEFDPMFGASLLDRANTPAMIKEYKAQFDAHYTAGMDEANAQEKALQIVGRNWGKSEVTGRSRAMKYRPEDYYSVSGSSEYIGDQLLKDIKTGFLMPFEFNKEDLILSGSNDHTARTASTGQPEYLVGIDMGDKGVFYLPGFTWKPDMQAQIDIATKNAETEVNRLRGMPERQAEKAKQMNIKGL